MRARAIDLSDGAVDGAIHEIEAVARELLRDLRDAHAQPQPPFGRPPDERLGAVPAGWCRAGHEPVERIIRDEVGHRNELLRRDRSGQGE
jgi:hypothetical protein